MANFLKCPPCRPDRKEQISFRCEAAASAISYSSCYKLICTDSTSILLCSWSQSSVSFSSGWQAEWRGEAMRKQGGCMKESSSLGRWERSWSSNISSSMICTQQTNSLQSGQFYHVIQERVLKGLLGGKTVLWVQSQTALQEVPEGSQASGVLCESFVLAEEIEQLAFGGDGDLHFLDSVGLGIGVVVFVEEAELLVEVTVHTQTLLEHLDAEPSSGLHHQSQHIVVACPFEQEVACKELVKTAANCPDIYAVSLLHRQLASQDNLWSSIVSGHQFVHFSAVLIDGKGSAEISQLYLAQIK